ncbi:MAG: hypothetical protein ABEI52_12970, partial [Halobacteriaceae archaeon]
RKSVSCGVKLSENNLETKTDKNVCQVLQPHYSDRVEPSDIVQGIRWEVVQRFAEAPEPTAVQGGESA